jgi:ParB/RepB/Spo0J family partition protein
MDDLVQSLKNVGQLYPLIVKTYGEGEASTAAASDARELDRFIKAGNQFEIIDGHRRWIAAELAGLTLLECKVFNSKERAAHAAMLHANIMREDMTPAEEGWQFVELATKHQWSMDDLVRTFRVSEGYVNERCDLVRKDTAVATAVHTRQLNLAQAKEINRATDATLRAYMLDQAIVHGANANTLRVMRQNWAAEQKAAQGELLPHTSAAQMQVNAEAPRVCIWCGRGNYPEHLRTIDVHWYHETDLRAVVDKLAVKNVTAALGGAA